MPDLTPNYTTTNPDGTVGALFTGGIQIPAGTVTPAVPAQRIQWIRQADGALIAFQQVIDGATDYQTVWQMQNPLQATNQRGTAALLLSGPHTSGNKWQVSAQARRDADFPNSASGAVIIDQDGGSSFVQEARMFADGGQGSAFANRNFNLNVPGTYLCLAGFSGFNSGGAAGSTTNDLVIDNVVRQTRTFFFNTTSVHTWVSFYAFTVTLAAGARTWRFSSNGGTTPLSVDTNDEFFFVLI